MTILSSLTRTIRICGTALAVASSAPLTFASAHEGHHMDCNEANINAMNADIQAMPDGQSKTIVLKEMQAAQDMLRKKDMKACTGHMNAAMEAMEK